MFAAAFTAHRAVRTALLLVPELLDFVFDGQLPCVELDDLHNPSKVNSGSLFLLAGMQLLLWPSAPQIESSRFRHRANHAITYNTWSTGFVSHTTKRKASSMRFSLSGDACKTCTRLTLWKMRVDVLQSIDVIMVSLNGWTRESLMH